MKKTLFTMGLALLTALLLPGAALAESRFVDVPEWRRAGSSTCRRLPGAIGKWSMSWKMA